MPAPKKLEDDEILTRAMQAFWATGWAGTSIRDLEATLGLAAPTIYRRVGSKDELFAAAIDHYTHTIVERRIATHLGSDSDDPLGDLWRFCESALASAKSSRFRGCLLTLAANEAPELSAATRRTVTRGLDRIRLAIVDAVERATTQGQIDTETPDVLGDRIAVAMQGLLVLSRAGTSRAEVERQALHALAEIRPAGATLSL